LNSNDKINSSENKTISSDEKTINIDLKDLSAHGELLILSKQQVIVSLDNFNLNVLGCLERLHEIYTNDLKKGDKSNINIIKGELTPSIMKDKKRGGSSDPESALARDVTIDEIGGWYKVFEKFEKFGTYIKMAINKQTKGGRNTTGYVQNTLVKPYNPNLEDTNLDETNDSTENKNRAIEGKK
jgi:hypothetical protein